MSQNSSIALVGSGTGLHHRQTAQECFGWLNTAFQGSDIFRKNKGLVVESGIIGATAFTTKDTKNTKQVTKRAVFRHPW